MKNINDWVAKYNYFDFTDRDGIMEIGHELFRDIIEKCIELEVRLWKLEVRQSDKFRGRKDMPSTEERKVIESRIIIDDKEGEEATKSIHKPPVIKTKVYKPRTKKTNQTESKEKK